MIQNKETYQYDALFEEYHPFGTTSYRSGRTETEVSLKRYKYVGKERDEETGLYYYGARYYSACLCRFVSVDPLAEHPKNIKNNPYCYVSNNPIFYKDPTGKMAEGNGDDEKGGDNKVAIDAGHGIKGSNNPKVDPGAVKDGQQEKDLALNISKSINSNLKVFGESTTMIRTGDLTVDGNSLTFRTDKAKEDGANIFVSIHINAAGNEDAGGFTVIFKGNGGNAAENKKLAQSIASNQFVMTVRKSETSERNGLSVLNRFSTTGAAVLVEVGFITNKNDVQLMVTRSSDIGRDIAIGIYKYMYGKEPVIQSNVPVPFDSSLEGAPAGF